MINGSNLYNDLLFSPGYSYTLATGQTQTINSAFSVNGSCGGHITIVSNISGSQSTINHPPGTVTVLFGILKDISATGGATFTANNSIDLGNNTGWDHQCPGCPGSILGWEWWKTGMMGTIGQRPAAAVHPDVVLRC
jgi:hypothetical protein